MRHLCVVVALIFAWTGLAHAQQQTRNWIFGNQAGLTFTPTPIPYSPVASTFNTQEGSSAISDPAGNLLLFSDGRQIWGANNAVIANGSGLLGGSSATQSAVIVPWPDGKCDKYFFFTVPAQEDTAIQTKALRYSLVTFTGGTPSVSTTMKNQMLQQPVSEKLTAIADATGFWVVAHGFDPTTPKAPANKEFYAFRVDASGLTTTPVVSTGFVHFAGSDASTNGVASAGQMQISPDGKRIACAVNTAFVEVWGFNESTGQVIPGTGVELNADPLQPNNQFRESAVYGLAFSPDSQMLYVSTLVGPSRLYQFDSTLTNTLGNKAPLAVGTGVAGSTYDIGQLQLGNDHRLYVARDMNQQLSVVQSPNVVGTACGFTPNGPTLAAGAQSRLGLPTEVQGPFSCAAPSSTCPPGKSPVVINGVTYCCDSANGPIGNNTDSICCKPACRPGTVETTANGVAFCCEIGAASPSLFCCTRRDPLPPPGPVPPAKP